MIKELWQQTITNEHITDRKVRAAEDAEESIVVVD
jgi:hypothetical protein